MSDLTEVVTPAPPPSQGTLINVGCLLAANSGFLNGLALSGLLAERQQAVAAVTGAYTTSAVAAAEGKVGFMLLQFKVIAAYFGGSLWNGLMNPKGIEWSKKPNALVVAALLVFVGALDYVATERFFVLLALALGLQNSWTSMLLKGNVLRTAHFSGATSDMGTILGQVLRGNTVDAWKFSIFARLAASFWTGGFLSILASKKYTEVSFLGSVALYLALWTMLSVRGTTKPVVVEQPSPVDVSLNVTLDETATLLKKDL
jgi:uncharacterized membrane protein YoaK (UPF0700 family)